MTRGDQRERDRAKNLKKHQEKQGDPLMRNASDAARLAEKVAKKKAEDAKNEENAKKDEASKRVEPKRTKTPDADSGLEALLESGLSKVKKK